jgi:propanol-preferring alcohol dehydrogenase
VQLMNTMRAAVADGIGEALHLRELPVPEPGAGQVLVRLAASGICHTDLSILDGEWQMKKPRFPLVPGHEAAGHVAACGDGVTSIKEGDRAGIFWLNSACGTCVDCMNGREPFCLRQINPGYTVDGTYAEYCLVSADYAVPLPEGPLELLAPIMCAGVTVYKALKELALPPGSWLVISGVGGAGHLAIQYARLLGLNVAAIDVDAEKVALAEQLGATFTINAVDHDDRRRSERVCHTRHTGVDEAAEPVAGVLLDLVKHVGRELEEHREHRGAPGSGKERQHGEQEEPGDEAGIHPVLEEPEFGDRRDEAEHGPIRRSRRRRLLP